MSDEYLNGDDYDDFEEEGTSTVVAMDKVGFGSFSIEDDDDGETSLGAGSPHSRVSSSSGVSGVGTVGLGEGSGGGSGAGSGMPRKVSAPMPSGDISVEDDSSDNVLNTSEKLRVYSDLVVSCMVGNKEIKKYAIDKLVNITNPRLFRDENFVIFQVIYNYRDRIKHINIDEDFMRLYLMRNRVLLEKAKGYIDIHAYGEVDGQEDLGYISGVLKHYKRLCGMPDVSVEEFETNFEKYLIEFKNAEAANAYVKGGIILNDGMMEGRKKLIGFEDSQNYIKRRLDEIEGLVNMNAGAGHVTMNEVIAEEKEDGRKPYKISDFDGLEALNKYYGGIYTGTFYQVLAPPKAGKTKFCARVCHTTAIKYGVNVSVWAQEGGKEAWTAQMRAIHFDYTYNTGADIRERKFGVSQEVILHDSFPSKELRDLEMSSKLDLSSNPDYGIVSYIERPFEVETFIDEIDTSVKANNSKMVILDYLQLIESATNKPERERVADAYKRLLNYCKINNVAILTPGQYKQETFNALLAKGDTSDADMRTSGGSSSEVLRTPDVIFALWATTEDLKNNRMEILSMPCRFNKAFPKIPVYADLEVSQFISLDEN